MAKRIYYTIERGQLNELGVSVVLDMLRYDGASVEHNAPSGYYLLSNEHGPELGRWQSFGIDIAVSSKSLSDTLFYTRQIAKGETSRQGGRSA